MEKNPNFMNAHSAHIVADYQKEEADAIKVGDRCQTIVGNKRGEVMFVGKVTQLDNGYWVGIKLDDPIGDCNGIIQGYEYFHCDPNHGLFVRPKDI